MTDPAVPPPPSFFKKLIHSLFGQLQWTHPPWLQRIERGFLATGNHVKLHKRQWVIGILALCTVGIVADFARLWWQGRPRPVELSVEISSPAATRLVDDATVDQLFIRFGGSAAVLDAVGKPVTSGIVLKPALEGTWTWDSDRALRFVPSADWPVGQKVSVTLDRSLFPNHVKLEKYALEFTTAQFTTLRNEAVFYQDPVNPRVKKIVVTVAFSHPVDDADFQKRVKLGLLENKGGMRTPERKELPFTINYNKFKGEAYVHSDTLSIPSHDSKVEVTVDAGVRSSRGGAPTASPISMDVAVPGMFSYFRMSGVDLTLVRNDKFDPEQVLILHTSVGVKEADIRKNITVHLLPKDRPASEHSSVIHNHAWSAGEVGPDVIKKSRAVTLTPIAADQEYATLHSFRYAGDVGRYVHVKIAKGVESFGGYVLADDYAVTIRVPEYPRELEIMHEGAILSLAGERKINVMSRGLTGVKFDVARILTSEINHLLTQTSGDFKNPSFNNQYYFNEDNITERFTEQRKLNAADPARTQYSAFDFSKYLQGNRHGLFILTASPWDPGESTTRPQREESEEDETDDTESGQYNDESPVEATKRLILVTDLGVLVKDNADGSHDVFVQSIKGGDAVAGARVDVIGRNGVSVVQRTTDEGGRASFPKLGDFVREKQPVAWLITRGEDLSFLPMNRYDRQLNYSRFDTGGIQENSARAGLSAYLFSDRGIYRPGDDVHVAMIVKDGMWKQRLAGVPVELVVVDSRGMEVEQRKLALPDSGFVELTHPTQETSPTGTWQVDAYLVKDGHRQKQLGSVSVRVEEFQPDRMKISSRFSAPTTRGWVAPEDLKALVTLKNLFGSPAMNRRVTGTLWLNTSYVHFPEYSAYQFHDPSQLRISTSEGLSEVLTNDNGEAEFVLPLRRFEKGTYRLSLQAEGFEADGGRSVKTNTSILVSPLKFLVGYKADGDLGYIKKASERSVEVLAINSDLKKVAQAGLKLHLVERRYVSVLTRQSNGTYRYESIQRDTTLKEEAFSISDNSVTINLPTDKPGTFFYLIKGADGTELNRLEFTVAGDANLTRNLEKNAELQVKPSRSDYAAGETVELQITAPYTGAGLITIERDKVYASTWFKTSTTSSVQTITMPAGVEGNAYVNVAFVRALDSREIFMSPLSYGVVPISVSRQKRTADVDIQVQNPIRPGMPLVMDVSTKTPSKVVVYAVDEGILQVAAYTMPDPLSFFLRKRALQVRTSQILDLLLPEFSVVKSVSSTGGDAEAALGKNLNPFKRKVDKPVVYWSGIVDAGPAATRLTYEVPSYFNGSLRLMAVAVNAEAVGTFRDDFTLANPLVIQPNVPTFVAPGDLVDVSVGLANTLKGSGNAAVTLQLTTSDHLKLLGDGKKSLTIAEGREDVVHFQVEATQVLGSGKLRFVGTVGGEEVKHSVELSVRPPSPYMTSIQTGAFKSGEKDVMTPRQMYPHFRTLDATASVLPLGMSRGLMRYLTNYPYGCTEQMVSKAFPALVMRDRPEFGYSAEMVSGTLGTVTRVLQSRQNEEGSFGFWAANSFVSPFQTVYAVHFLTEAKERGYPISKNLMDRAVGYLKKLAEQESDSLDAARVRAYAIYVLTRQGLVMTNALQSLREELLRTKQWQWDSDLTAVYAAATHKLLKQDSEAFELLKKLRVGDPQKANALHFYDANVRDAQYLYLVSKHFPEAMKFIEPNHLQSFVNTLLNGSYNTLSSSYAILALDSYARNVGGTEAAQVAISEILGKDKLHALDVPAGLFPTVSFSEKAQGVHISSSAPFSVFWQVTQTGFDVELPKEPIKSGLEVTRELVDAGGKTVTSVKLGEEVSVRVRIRSLGSTLNHVAVVDLLPGGFEAVLNTTGGSQVGRIKSGGSFNPVHADVREDRVLLFGDVPSSMQEFSYRIKATNKGTYSLPPPFAEAMYNRTVQARGLGGQVIVD